MHCALQHCSAPFCGILASSLHLEVSPTGGAGGRTVQYKCQCHCKESIPAPGLSFPCCRRWPPASLGSPRALQRAHDVSKPLSPGSPAAPGLRPQLAEAVGRPPEQAQAACPAVAAAVCLGLSLPILGTLWLPRPSPFFQGSLKQMGPAGSGAV